MKKVTKKVRANKIIVGMRLASGETITKKSWKNFYGAPHTNPVCMMQFSLDYSTGGNGVSYAAASSEWVEIIK